MVLLCSCYHYLKHGREFWYDLFEKEEISYDIQKLLNSTIFVDITVDVKFNLKLLLIFKKLSDPNEGNCEFYHLGS